MGNVEVYMSVIFSDVCEEFFFFFDKAEFSKEETERDGRLKKKQIMARWVNHCQFQTRKTLGY